MNDHEIPWRDMVAALHRRRRLIANVWISGAAIIAFALLMTGPRYESTAKLMVTNDRPSTIAPEDAAAPAEKVSDEDLNAEVTLLSSDGLVREVLEPYRGTTYEPAEGTFKRFTGLPRDVVSWVYRTLHGIPQESSFDRWVDHTRKHLEVELVKKSNLISVSYGDRSVSPEWTSKLVNDLIDKHLQHHDRRSRQSDAFRFYENQLAVLHGKVSEAEQAQQAFFQREGLDSLPEQRGNWRQRLVDLNTELATAERDLTSVQARADFLAAAAAMAAQRHARVIGVFARLWLRDGKPRYLAHIPRVWRLLERALLHPALAPLRRWFDAHVPAAQRRAPEAA